MTLLQLIPICQINATVIVVSPSTIPEKYRRFNSDAPSEQGHCKQTQHLLCSNLLSKWYNI